MNVDFSLFLPEFILAGAALSFWAASADAATRNLYLGETGAMPKKIEVFMGDRIVISNGTQMQHTVEITGRADWFGRRSAVHDLTVPVHSYVVVPIDGEMLKPGSYNVECGIHKRMRATIVVREPGGGTGLPRDGERWDRSH